MRYALNAAPINGWQTLPGFGASSAEITATGIGHRVTHGAGTAVMMMSAIGSGLIAVTGQGAADEAITATGIGYARRHGFGLAEWVLSGGADGKIIPFMGGRARLVMSAMGDGKVAALGVGSAAWRFDAVANGLRATLGRGEAPMVLSGLASIPHPHVPPAVFSGTHKSRQMRVGEESRRFVVQPDLPLRQSAENRNVRVPATNRRF